MARGKFLRILAFVCLAGIVTLFAIVFFLSTPSGGEFLWARGSSFLRGQGYSVTASKVDFKLFDHFFAENLKLQGKNLSADVEMLKIQYELHLFPLGLELKEFVVENSEVHSSPSSDPEPPSKPSRSFAETLEHPPASLQIRDLHFRHIKVFLEGPLAAQAELKNLDLEAHLNSGKALVKLGYDFTLLQPFAWASEGKQLRAPFSGQGKLDLDIRTENLILKIEKLITKHHWESRDGQWQSPGQPPFRWQNIVTDLKTDRPGFLKIQSQVHSKSYSLFEALKFDGDISWPESQKNLDLTAAVLVDKNQIFKGTLKAATDQKTEFEIQATVQAPSDLLKKFIALKQNLQISLDSRILWKDHAPRIWSLPWDRLLTSEVETQTKMQIPAVDNGSYLLQGTSIELSAQQTAQSQWKNKVEIQSHVLRSPFTRQPVALRTLLNSDVGLENPQQMADLQLMVGDLPLLSAKVKGTRTAEEAQVEINYELQNKKLWPLLLYSKTSADPGEYHLRGELQARNQIPNSGWKDIFQKIDFKTGKVTGGGTIDVVTAPQKVLVKAPLKFTHELSLSGQMSGAFSLIAPSVEMPGLAAIKDLQVAAQVQQSPDQKINGKINVHGSESHVVEKQSSPFSSFDVDVTGAYLAPQVWLQDFSVRFAKDLMVLSAQGKFNLKDGSGSVDSKTQLNFPSQGFSWAGLEVKGRVDVPLRAALEPNKSMFIEGLGKFENFSAKKGDLAVEGMNGTLEVREDISYRNKRLGFSRVSHVNAFTRAAFDRVQPLLDGVDPLRIDKVQLQDKSLGPILVYASLNQNIFSLHRFDVTLPKGSLGGESYVDIKPDSLSYGLLLRMNGVLLSQLVPKKMLGTHQGDDSPLSLRTAFVYNINRSALEGRMDITELGTNQLNTMLNVLDPEYLNETFNKVRGLISYAYPTYVGLLFSNGFTDMDVQLNVAKAPPVVGVSISPWLADVSQKIKELASPP